MKTLYKNKWIIAEVFAYVGAGYLFIKIIIDLWN